jgi:hypothetical protein
MKNIKHSIFCLITAFLIAVSGTPPSLVGSMERQAFAELNPGPYSLENLGVFIRSSTLSNSLTFKHPVTDQTHFLQLYYLASEINKTPFQILDLNLDTGEIRLVDGGLGRPDPFPMLVYPGTGIVYIGSQASPGAFTRYDVLAGQAKMIHRISDVSPQGFVIGDDLNIYIGQAIKGHLERYDPRLDPSHDGAIESLTRYGIVRDPGAPYYRYIYSVASDGAYAYMAIRDQNRSPIWSFVVKNLTTGEERVYWEEHDSTFISAHSTRRGYGVGCYSVPEGRFCFRFDGFSNSGPVALNNLPGDPLPIEWPATGLPSGYTLDTSDVTADSATGGRATVRWKIPGDVTWREKSIEGIRLEPTPIKKLNSFSSTYLIGFPTAYGPTFLVDTVRQKGVVLGRGIISMYNSHYSKRHQKWFITGYPSAWTEYDPTKPWTLSYTTNRYHSETNPHFLPRPIEDQAHMMAKYFYHVAEDFEGTMYLGGHHERDSTGGSLTWYRPASTKSGAIPASWSSPWITENYGVLRLPFLTYDIASLTSVLNGSKIIFASRSCCGETGPAKLFVFDAAQKKIENEWMIPGLTHLGAVLEVAPGVVLGMTGDNVYSINVMNGQAGISLKAPGVFSGSPLRGPDGWVWGFWGKSLYRFNVSTELFEKILDTAAGSMTFHQGDLYIAQGAEIKRIKGLFPAEATAPDDIISSPPEPLIIHPFINRFFPNKDGALTFTYSVDGSGHVEMWILDRRGQKIRVIENSEKLSGVFSATWDGRNEAGQVVASGIYSLLATKEGARLQRKIVVVK